MSTTYNSALSAYRSATIDGNAEAADGPQLIQLLLDGVVERVSDARGHIQRNAVAAKGESLGRAMRIIAALRACLDESQGPELVQRLDALYDYCERRIAQANAENRSDYLDEVIALLNEIRGAWREMRAQQEPT